jgi:hypothetical protein
MSGHPYAKCATPLSREARKITQTRTYFSEILYISYVQIGEESVSHVWGAAAATALSS